MEENIHFQHIMSYDFKKVKRATEKQKQKTKKQFVQCMEKVLWLINISKVDCEVSCWRFLTGHAPQSSRPVEVHSDQMETFVENNQCYTIWEIAGLIKISKSIKLLVKMKNIFYFMEKTKQTFWPTQYIVM